MFVAGAWGLSAAPSLRGNLGIHDPSTIIQCKDKYYLFGTGQGIVSKVSTDKTFWTAGPSVFSCPPAWTTNAVPGFAGVFWAPDIFFLNGRYCLYYSVSSWASQVSAIGLVTNPTLDPSDPAYQWTDQGMVIHSGNGSPFNTIDPSVTKDAAGNPWMAFGSYWNGIYLVQLDPNTGLRLSASSPTYRLAYNSSIEANCLFRRGGYYYLFVNWGSCCSGVNSTYHIRVGRSTSITGPYLDRNGVDLANNGGTLFLQGTGKFTGPGHVGILSEGGQQWFSYHYYDAGDWDSGAEAFGQPKFDLVPLSWTADNWPVFTNDWSAVYHFEADAREENGQYYGLLVGGASTQTDPLRGRVLHLSGTNQYVQLPPGVAYARTFAAVVKWNGGGAWQRLFDFGTDTSSYVMLTPASGTGRLRCDIRANGATQVLEGPSALPVGVWSQVAVTLDGQKAVLYLNGQAVATNASMTRSPLEVRAQTNYLGRSKFVADPDFSGQIASFRVYGRALSAAEIAAPYPVIAEPADGALLWPGSTIAFSGRAADLTDLPLAPSRLTWRVEYVQEGRTNTVLGPLSGVTNGLFTVPTNAAGGGTCHIWLTATDAAGRQRSVASTLLAANPPQVSPAYYPFRADARDAYGHFHGMLNGGAGIQQDPARGPVLHLSGNSQWVSLPAGAANFQTFMAWVKWNGGGPWQRIFDFGNNTDRYSVLTPSAANGRLRFNITLNSIAGEQLIDAPASLPVGVWTHVAVVLDGNSGVLYTNGVAVATNQTLNLVPQNLGAINNYLGKSQWPDPYFNGQLSGVRLVSRPLTPAEITAPQVMVLQPAHGATYLPGESLAFAGAAFDFYDTPIAATGLTWMVQYCYAAGTNIVLGPLTGATNGSFSIPGAGLAASNGFYRLWLAATDSAGRKATNFVDAFPRPVAAASTDWASYYPFTTGAQDASNRFNATLLNGASIATDATRSKVLNLGGGSQYASLPAGAGNFQTVSAWVKWNGGGAWQRILDFGQNNNDWLFITPLDAAGKMQCAITTDRSRYVQVIQAPASLTPGVWTHIALAFDGRQGILYSNGVAVAINHSVNLLPSDIRSTRNYFGRSQYAADPYFAGRLDAIRLNSRALAPAELFAPMPLITQPAPGTLYAGGDTVGFAGTATDASEATLPPSALSWLIEYLHDHRTEPFLGPLHSVDSGSFSIPTRGPAGTNVFYRLHLTATNAAGLSRTISTDLPPRVSLLHFATVPPGLVVNLDDQTLTTPASVAAVAGLSRTLSAPSPQSLSGSNYNFVLWSDGGTASHLVNVPTSNATYTASFLPPTLGWSATGTNLILTWPAWAGSWTLSSATNLHPPVFWRHITNTPVSSNGFQILSLAGTNGAQFYRLECP